MAQIGVKVGQEKLRPSILRRQRGKRIPNCDDEDPSDGEPATEDPESDPGVNATSRRSVRVLFSFTEVDPNMAKAIS